ncbi:hypothetical protein, conserved [Trypanosoma brucei gambiense DAL972]|uniref:Haemolysin-III related n=3 Tax=Trypanosoma brucei TaxID=5691 RepID=Q57VJ4_TRYB2|nr:hypothetical protein, conserved [Trypanosoma brucei gambiense DAL972]XP_846240.1 hypothetical protein, conserved [Trypanosoma brucei brucei TREU927]AAX70375.1 hypothetical protein, conserved [Trypanosoma brucei]RHW71657.1 hypothetical protein DPX39_070072000 [Trypanosoma brucei equiperdum]AAZ12681.1 hypothetical protein, conserved [Trypanosoma brucei brucei TREU927]CBH12822.1 hypothetical protein, conserved [Trypanosoma brucei gambiense DAL972]|eukprot:XP_011775101.1 hypothetical protein, conserved [Trypanosoma brucei gambiense DAL972]
MEVELEPFASWLVCLFSVISHVTFLPTVHHFFKQRYVYEAAMGIFGMTASLMYHICQVLNAEIILDEAGWHRVDNILVVSFLGAWSVYMCAFRDLFTERCSKYCLLMMCVLFQARGAWKAVNTIVPVFICIGFPICVYAYRWRLPSVFPNRLFGFALVMAVAVIFFIKGLDDENDPYKMYHSLWHFFCGIASYLMWTLLKVPGVTGVMGKSIHV